MLTDQEGGLVRRLPGAPVLAERQIGRSPNGMLLASQAGTGAGHNLRGVGMNVNLAGCVSVKRPHRDGGKWPTCMDLPVRGLDR